MPFLFICQFANNSLQYLTIINTIAALSCMLFNPDFSLALKDGKSQKNLPGGPAPIFLLLKAKEKLERPGLPKKFAGTFPKG